MIPPYRNLKRFGLQYFFCFLDITQTLGICDVVDVEGMLQVMLQKPLLRLANVADVIEILLIIREGNII